MTSMTRPDLVNAARELGLWGKEVAFAFTNAQIEQALRCHRPPDLDRVSLATQKVFKRLPAGLPEGGAPAPRPSAPIVPDTMSSYDIAGTGLVQESCPGSVADNNITCLLCPELRECTAQALEGIIRYPAKWTAQRDAVQAVAVEVVSAEVREAAHVVLTPSAPSSGTPPIQAETLAPTIPMDKPLSPAKLSKLSAALLKLLDIKRAVITTRRSGVDAAIDGVPRLRLARLTTSKPTVRFLGVVQSMPGLVTDKGDSLWDGQHLFELEAALNTLLK